MMCRSMFGTLLALVLVLTAATLVLGHPHHHQRHYEEDVYDQRQNGSDNFRIHIDGIVGVHAPADVLIALASAGKEDNFEQQLAELLGALGEDSASSSTTSTTTTTTESEPSQVQQSDEATSSEKPQNEEQNSSSEKPQNDEEKPQENQDSASDKPDKETDNHTEKPAKKNRHRVRLSSFLFPLLRRL